MNIVLVTGGAGFIGSHLVERLLERGGEIRILDNLSTGSLRNLQPAADHHIWPVRRDGGALPHRLELMVGDVRDEKLVRKAMRHVGCVFHLAAVPGRPGGAISPADVHTVNVQGTLNVLQAATAEGVPRVVFASCASVYGTPESITVPEDQPPQPVTMFAASKLAGEIYCRAYHAARHLETVILRYFPVYGPRAGAAANTMVPALIETLRRRRRPAVEGDGRTSHDLVFVQDAVAATLAAGEQAGAAGRVLNVGSGQNVCALEILDILNRLMRIDVIPRFTRIRDPIARPLRGRISLAGEVLGWTPSTSLVTGLARSVQFLAERGNGDEPLLAEVASSEERSDI